MGYGSEPSSAQASPVLQPADSGTQLPEINLETKGLLYIVQWRLPGTARDACKRLVPRPGGKQTGSSSRPGCLPPGQQAGSLTWWEFQMSYERNLGRGRSLVYLPDGVCVARQLEPERCLQSRRLEFSVSEKRCGQTQEEAVQVATWEAATKEPLLSQFRQTIELTELPEEGVTLVKRSLWDFCAFERPAERLGKVMMQRIDMDTRSLLQAAGFWQGAFQRDYVLFRSHAISELALIGQLRLRFEEEFMLRELRGCLFPALFGDVALTRLLKQHNLDLELACSWFQKFLAEFDAIGGDEIMLQLEAKFKQISDS